YWCRNRDFRGPLHLISTRLISYSHWLQLLQLPPPYPDPSTPAIRLSCPRDRSDLRRLHPDSPPGKPSPLSEAASGQRQPEMFRIGLPAAFRVSSHSGFSVSTVR